MNTIEPIRLKGLQTMDYASLMNNRVRKILMICSDYDAFILEEDGQIETQIYYEYIGLNISSPPRFIWATTSDAAKSVIDADRDFDMVICMYNSGDPDIFDFAAHLKEVCPNVPFVLLTHISPELARRMATFDLSNVDFVFSWHGNAELIVAIIKLFEDLANADNDILECGVQAILLVEDSVRYYSTYLPGLYKMVLKQSDEYTKDTFNEQIKKSRKRARPKILLATNYEDACNLYSKYKENLLGVISDVGFVLHKGDDPRTEKLDAGLDLVKTIRAEDPFMPILLQSSQGSIEAVATELGVGFLEKYSKTLMARLSEYIREEFGFGDLVFRDSNNAEWARVSNLKQLEEVIKTVPNEIIINMVSRNMFSKWMFSRGLFTLARQFKSLRKEQFDSLEEMKAFVVQEIHDYHAMSGRGIIAKFEKDLYDRYIWFARLGEGSLGGKARGLGFLNTLIQRYNLTRKYENIRISIPRTVVVATDYFERFIEENDLQYVIDSDSSDEEILYDFVASRLPAKLSNDLKAYVRTVRTPLAIRSSSNLEDSTYQPFAGVYSTYMIPLTENKDYMFRMLCKAIKSVYASVFFKGSRTYISSTGNILSEEKMAVVIQSVCGTRHGNFHYPMLSGVARSVNYYPIGAEKAEDGIVQVAFGLGRTIVNGGETLRFSPKHPKKILQLSVPEIALKDTQKTMYALDLNPHAFRINKDDGINFVQKNINEMLDGYDHPELVASTYTSADGRFVPGIEENGSRIISYDAILKYGRFPLPQLLSDIMKICKKELLCDVEIEFAMDLVPDSNGRECELKLLQIRPISDYIRDHDYTMEKASSELCTVVLTSDKALGNGMISGMRHIVLVPEESFDSARTAEIAADISRINSDMLSRKENYMLIGPGRWGSSDPWLGIPVSWSDISAARTIVECAIEGFRIEPSQGTHFFQNITSLGVGYISLDTVTSPKALNKTALESFKIVEKTPYVTVYELPSELVVYIDRNNSNAVAGLRP